MPLSEGALAGLLTWLEIADFPDPPLRTIPGVEAFDVEWMGDQLLWGVPRGAGINLLKLRYLAARYGPPEIQALAEPDGLTEPPPRYEF